MESSLCLNVIFLQVIVAGDKASEEFDLGGKSHFTFGRLADTCDICLVGAWLATASQSTCGTIWQLYISQVQSCFVTLHSVVRSC